MTTFTGKRVASYRTSVSKDGLFGLQLIDENNRGATIEHLLDRVQAVAIARAIFDARDSGQMGPARPGHGQADSYANARREPHPRERTDNGWHYWDTGE